MTEDRRNERRELALIEVSWDEASGRHEVRTSDISSSGCFIFTIAPVSVGERIKFKLHLPADDPIEIQGEVVYKLDHNGFGIRFIPSMADHDWKRVERLINA